MARIRFVGNSQTCVWLGVTFQREQWIAGHGLNAGQLARLQRHPHFEVDGLPQPLPKTPAPRKPAPRKPAPNKKRGV